MTKYQVGVCSFTCATSSCTTTGEDTPDTFPLLTSKQFGQLPHYIQKNIQDQWVFYNMSSTNPGGEIEGSKSSLCRSCRNRAIIMQREWHKKKKAAASLENEHCYKCNDPPPEEKSHTLTSNGQRICDACVDIRRKKYLGAWNRRKQLAIRGMDSRTQQFCNFKLGNCYTPFKDKFHRHYISNGVECYLDGEYFLTCIDCTYAANKYHCGFYTKKWLLISEEKIELYRAENAAAKSFQCIFDANWSGCQDECLTSCGDWIDSNDGRGSEGALEGEIKRNCIKRLDAQMFDHACALKSTL